MYHRLDSWTLRSSCIADGMARVWYGTPAPPSLPESLPAMDPPAHPSIGPSHPAQKCFLVRMDWVKEEGGREEGGRGADQQANEPSITFLSLSQRSDSMDTRRANVR